MHYTTFAAQFYPMHIYREYSRHIGQTLLLVLLIVLGAVSASAQFNIALGLATGYSKHADSYIEEETFRTFEFTGFRAIELEGRIEYRLPTETSIYASFKYSPKTTITPYQYTYPNIGIEQVIPSTSLFVTAAYGPNKSNAEGNALSEGNLLLLGTGIKTEITRLQFSIVTGAQVNQAPFLRDNEFRYNLGLYFSIFNNG